MSLRHRPRQTPDHPSSPRATGRQAGGLLIIALLLALLSITPTQAASPVAVLVKDINPGSHPGWTELPEEFITVRSTAYFRAGDEAHGFELWKTDGTAAGTALVKDITPGPLGSYPNFFIQAQGMLFFTAGEPVHGREVWKSDGTPEGTVRVTTLPVKNWYVEEIISVNGLLYFIVNKDEPFRSGPYQIMRTDGTPGGTLLIKDNISAYPSLAAFENKLFFAIGGELWSSDGTPGGTKLLKDISSTDPKERITAMGQAGGMFFFSSYNYDSSKRGSDFTSKLWKSDGTPQGTSLVKQFNAAPDGIDGFTDVDGTLFFTANDAIHGPELWKSDGTAAGTIIVKDINPNSKQSPRPWGPYALKNINGTLFFGYENEGYVYQLWKSDGTEQGTVLLGQIGPLDNLVDFNGTLFMRVNYKQLWKSDGTPSGTTLVKAFDETPEVSKEPRTLHVLNDALIITTVNEAWGPWDITLWKSDGTTTGTLELTQNPINNSSNINYLTDVDGVLFFAAVDGSQGGELRKSDGTPSGTVLVKDINPGPAGSNPRSLTNVGGRLFFIADDGTHGDELWISDGTDAGTRLVEDIAPGGSGSSAGELTDVDGTLFFVANDGAHGFELWKSNGTADGTSLVKDLQPGGYGEIYMRLTNVDGTLFFLTDRNLWISDGTAAGTTSIKTLLVEDPYSGPAASSNPMTVVNGTIFFSAADNVTGGSPYTDETYFNIELRKSDGTESGTLIVKDINPGQANTEIRQTANVGGTLFFIAREPVHGAEIWKSDGTPEGTVMVKDTEISRPSSLTVVGSTLFFGADNAAHGRQLWKSDGTSHGTFMVSTIREGLGYDSVQSIVPVGSTGRVLFDAAGHNSGVELWLTDGTSEGTIQLQDLAPGPGSSNPAKMLISGDKVFLTADSPDTGRELRAIDLQELSAMPIAKHMNLWTKPGLPISRTLSASAPAGAQLSYTLETNGTKGTAVITNPATGAFTYTPNANASGTDSFTFKVSSGGLESPAATVKVLIERNFLYLPAMSR